MVFSIVFFIISIYFGNNPLNNSLTSKIKIISVLPQGWAFFTKKSTEPRLYIYKVERNNLSEINLRNFSSEYYFGMSRDNRILNLQIVNVFKKVNTDSSIHYEFNSINTKELTEAVQVDTLNFNQVLIKSEIAPNIKGKYLLIVQLMLPWPLLHYQPEYPSKFIIYPINVSHSE